jgi:hypothetical protein
MTDRDLGITVMPEYAQSEGIEAVLDRISGIAGANSLTTSPYVATPAPEGQGHREPPSDGGLGKKRLLDRPLWGQRELWMTAAPSFRPDPALYDGLAYRPPEPDALTEEQGAVVGQFLDAARSRGMEVWLQIQAAIPPCYRVQFGGPLPADEPLLPDGAPFPGRVDRNASLASPDVRAYVRAIVRDLWRNYPQIDGLKFDWPEYPVYHFDALFFDFNPAMAPHAAALGLDLEALARGTMAFLSDLGDGTLRRRAISLDDLDSFLDSLFAAYPVLSDLLALRRAVVTDFASFLREAVDDASAGKCGLFLQCFPPPLNKATGFDIAAVAPFCTAMGVKFYTMHWPLIEADYLAALTHRTDLPPVAVARILSRLLGLSPETARDPQDIRYPEPHEPHPASSTAIRAKIIQAREQAGTTPVWGMSHGYGPLEDVIRRYQALGDGPVQVNRYAYLSDEKLAALGAQN